MAHLDSLGREHVSDHVSHDARDVRGAVVRGPDGTTLGEVVDVIFDHDTMEISYLVVDSGGWLEAGSFLLPAMETGQPQTETVGAISPRPLLDNFRLADNTGV